MSKKAELRRSQIVFTYGPGSIVDLRTPSGSSVSGVMRSLDNWTQTARGAYSGPKAQKISLERLKNIINDRYDMDINDFRWPPVEFMMTGGEDYEKPSLDSIRLPIWLTCPKCNILKRARDFYTPTSDSPERMCTDCNIPVVPTRFIIICDNGHMSDFDYEYWLKVNGKGDQNKDGCKQKRTRSGEVNYHPRLKLIQGNSLSLASMTVICDNCKRAASMSTIFDQENLPMKCSGNHLWAEKYDEDCESDVTVQQRSSRSIYLPIHESAIDIPPYNDLPEILGSHWAGILNVVKASDNLGDGEAEVKTHIGYQLDSINADIVGEQDYTTESLFQAVKDHYENEDKADRNPRVDEFKRLNDKNYDRDSSSPDILLKFEEVPDMLKNQIERLVRVDRMREIRALVGFTRKVSSNPRNTLWKKKQNWLPAIETNGEGVFFSFNKNFMENIESESDNELSFEILENWKTRLAEDQGFIASGPTRDTEIGIKFIFLHTLAHVLIRQLSLDSGYNSASLHERIYCSEDMAGILIYTASVDSEGTLGGLSRIGRTENFKELMINALNESEFCSSDPLCEFGDMSISEPLNGASCYCCSILPETCCDHYNLFLDRRLLNIMKI